MTVKCDDLELVCPWCGFNIFAISHDGENLIYNCQTCNTESLHEDKLVSYPEFEKYTRQYCLESPEILIEIRNECINADPWHNREVRGFTWFEIRRVIDRLLGIPSKYEDCGPFSGFYNKTELENHIYETYLRDPRIVLDYRDINKIYNDNGYKKDIIMGYLSKLLLKVKHNYSDNEPKENGCLYHSSGVSDNCGGGNIGQAIYDIDVEW